jgi:hypothetical protein
MFQGLGAPIFLPDSIANPYPSQLRPIIPGIVCPVANLVARIENNALPFSVHVSMLEEFNVNYLGGVFSFPTCIPIGLQSFHLPHLVFLMQFHDLSIAFHTQMHDDLFNVFCLSMYRELQIRCRPCQTAHKFSV